MSATAYRCPENETHLKDKEGGRAETQFGVPVAPLDGCWFCAFATNAWGIDKGI
jgi:hypothetical protein